MEVTLLGPHSVRIKSKTSIIAVNPVGIKGKVAADCVLLFTKDIASQHISLEFEAPILAGPGEYEVKGLKLTGLGKTDAIAYVGRIDSLDVCITKASLLSQTKDTLSEYTMVILEEDVLTDAAQLAKLGASIVIIYGEKAVEFVKASGKEITPVSKYAVTREKLPGESEIVLLG